MKTEIQIKQHKYSFIKSYQHLWHLEEAISTIRLHTTDQLQLSVLGKMAKACISTDKRILDSKKELKAYWKGLLGATSDFGLFCNPEIGTLFIAGTLVSQFLNDMDGKALGAMASGPYGILRGLGMAQNETTDLLKNLENDHFLMIVRGYDYELMLLKAQLESLEQTE